MRNFENNCFNFKLIRLNAFESFKFFWESVNKKLKKIISYEKLYRIQKHRIIKKLCCRKLQNKENDFKLYECEKNLKDLANLTVL